MRKLILTHYGVKAVVLLGSRASSGGRILGDLVEDGNACFGFVAPSSCFGEVRGDGDCGSFHVWKLDRCGEA
jgi:hypothetical protein